MDKRDILIGFMGLLLVVNFVLSVAIRTFDPSPTQILDTMADLTDSLSDLRKTLEGAPE